MHFFGGPAPSVVFLFLLVALVGTGPLLLVTAVGVCLLMHRAFCMLGCFSFFRWLCLVVVFWRSGASARLGCWSSSLGTLGGCVGVCLVAFVFWRSGASASSSSWWVRLPFVQWPSAASAYGWCCVLRFGSSSSSSLPFSFSSSSWFSSSLSVCVLWSSSCFPCLVSGLPLCLAWSAPPDLFFLSSIVWGVVVAMVAAAAAVAAVAAAVVVVVVGVCSPLVYGVWPAFIH